MSEGENVYKNYLELLQKANLAERRNPMQSITLLQKCLEIIQGNRIIFIDLHPKRRRDELIIKDRISRLQSKLSPAEDESVRPAEDADISFVVKEKSQSFILEEITERASALAHDFKFQLAFIDLHEAHQIANSIDETGWITKITNLDQRFKTEKLEYERKLTELDGLIEDSRNYRRDNNLFKIVKSCQKVIAFAEKYDQPDVIETHKEIMMNAEESIEELKKRLPGSILKFNTAADNNDLQIAIDLTGNIAEMYRQLDDMEHQYQYLEQKELLQISFWQTNG